jgi:hypothetical protein
MAWVFNNSTSTGIDRLVLLAIADAANDEGAEAWPSMSTIARKAGVDKRTVARSIARLEQLGELRRSRNGGRPGHGGVSNSYRVCMASPQKEGQSAPSDGAPLGAERPEVGAESPFSGGGESPDPSLTIHTHPRSGLSAVDNGYVGPTDAGRTAAAEAKRAIKGRPVGENGAAV